MFEEAQLPALPLDGSLDRRVSRLRIQDPLEYKFNQSPFELSRSWIFFAARCRIALLKIHPLIDIPSKEYAFSIIFPPPKYFIFARRIEIISRKYREYIRITKFPSPYNLIASPNPKPIILVSIVIINYLEFNLKSISIEKERETKISLEPQKQTFCYSLCYREACFNSANS